MLLFFLQWNRQGFRHQSCYLDFMSKSVKRVVKNSFFQTLGSFAQSGLNFALTLGYAHFLGPAVYGSLVTSQAQVLVWNLLVDLGLSNSLIGALTSAEGGKSASVRQGFRARDLLLRVLFLRLLGALAGTVIVFLAAHAHDPDHTGLFWQNVAFTPCLFAFALQQTASAFAAFRGKQGLSVIANTLGVAMTVALALFLAWKKAPLYVLLLSQSWGGLFSSTVIFGYFLLRKVTERANYGGRRVQSRVLRGPWGPEAWKALARDAWPHAIAFAAFNFWQRLDQIAASRLLGLEKAGQYALAVRLMAVPLLGGAAISAALFPDFQRVGRDGPHRVRVILGMLSKAVYRYGVLAAALILLLIGLLVGPAVPKFRPALWLLPHFIPGMWAYWLQSFIMNGLFGIRAYAATVRVHAAALGAYLIGLLVLPWLFGLAGVAWALNLFCFVMCWFGFSEARKAGLIEPGFLLYSAYTAEEHRLIDALGFSWWRPGQGLESKEPQHHGPKVRK
jgi:O-antigen/teichoic acid export membrane protein